VKVKEGSSYLVDWWQVLAHVKVGKEDVGLAREVKVHEDVEGDGVACPGGHVGPQPHVHVRLRHTTGLVLTRGNGFRQCRHAVELTVAVTSGIQLHYIYTLLKKVKEHAVQQTQFL
jgi:hypothetical protein